MLKTPPTPPPQVLQNEIHYSPNHNDGIASRALRHTKRYRVPESPLLQLAWWRLVFDEAQQVGLASLFELLRGQLHLLNLSA